MTFRQPRTKPAFDDLSKRRVNDEVLRHQSREPPKEAVTFKGIKDKDPFSSPTFNHPPGLGCQITMDKVSTVVLSFPPRSLFWARKQCFHVNAVTNRVESGQIGGITTQNYPFGTASQLWKKLFASFRERPGDGKNFFSVCGSVPIAEKTFSDVGTPSPRWKKLLQGF
ncbi:MAG: hypothetical protein JWM68_96 [Verrucomicrobiales bacterium]|nr:hypothetical protein [Verrucomicrobiales bacterium]